MSLFKDDDKSKIKKYKCECKIKQNKYFNDIITKKNAKNTNIKNGIKKEINNKFHHPNNKTICNTFQEHILKSDVVSFKNDVNRNNTDINKKVITKKNYKDVEKINKKYISKTSDTNNTPLNYFIDYSTVSFDQRTNTYKDIYINTTEDYHDEKPREFFDNNYKKNQYKDLKLKKNDNVEINKNDNKLCRTTNRTTTIGWNFEFSYTIPILKYPKRFFKRRPSCKKCYCLKDHNNNRNNNHTSLKSCKQLKDNNDNIYKTSRELCTMNVTINNDNKINTVKSKIDKKEQNNNNNNNIDKIYTLNVNSSKNKSVTNSKYIHSASDISSNNQQKEIDNLTKKLKNKLKTNDDNNNKNIKRSKNNVIVSLKKNIHNKNGNNNNNNNEADLLYCNNKFNKINYNNIVKENINLKEENNNLNEIIYHDFNNYQNNLINYNSENIYSYGNELPMLNYTSELNDDRYFKTICYDTYNETPPIIKLPSPMDFDYLPPDEYIESVEYEHNHSLDTFNNNNNNNKIVNYINNSDDDDYVCFLQLYLRINHITQRLNSLEFKIKYILDLLQINCNNNNNNNDTTNKISINDSEKINQSNHTQIIKVQSDNNIIKVQSDQNQIVEVKVQSDNNDNIKVKPDHNHIKEVQSISESDQEKNEQKKHVTLSIMDKEVIKFDDKIQENNVSKKNICNNYDRYVIVKSDSNPNVLVIKPPTNVDYKTCECSDNDHCLRIPVYESLNNCYPHTDCENSITNVFYKFYDYIKNSFIHC